MPSQVQVLGNLTQQLSLEYELSLFVLLTRLESFVILPANRLFTLLAVYIANDVAARCHVSLARVAFSNVNDAVEEVGFAVLAAEVPAYDIVVVGKVGLAGLAAIDPVRIEVDIVCQPHLDCKE